MHLRPWASPMSLMAPLVSNRFSSSGPFLGLLGIWGQTDTTTDNRARASPFFELEKDRQTPRQIIAPELLHSSNWRRTDTPGDNRARASPFFELEKDTTTDNRARASPVFELEKDKRDSASPVRFYRCAPPFPVQVMEL